MDELALLITIVFILPLVLLLFVIIITVIISFVYLNYIAKSNNLKIRELIGKPPKKLKNNKKADVGLTNIEKVVIVTLSFFINALSVWFFGYFYFRGKGYLRKAKQITKIMMIFLFFYIITVLGAFIISSLLR